MKLQWRKRWRGRGEGRGGIREKNEPPTLLKKDVEGKEGRRKKREKMILLIVCGASVIDH
jgi:hypothetical protein